MAGQRHSAFKRVAYEAAAPGLHPALFQGLLSGYHDVYGDLDPPAALDLLHRLDLPPDTEHLPALRAVLAAGRRNHHKDPGAWDAAARSFS